MKILIDENLPESLLQVLDDRFVGSVHVRSIGLDSTDDSELWSYAGLNGFAVLTQDSDFERLASLAGPPPRVILVRTGNLRPRSLRAVVAAYLDDIETFLQSSGGAVLTLTRPTSF